MTELTNLIRDMSILILDLADLRDDLIEFFVPGTSVDPAAQLLGRPPLRVLRQKERERLNLQADA
jgi:hypothetical protein